MYLWYAYRNEREFSPGFLINWVVMPVRLSQVWIGTFGPQTAFPIHSAAGHWKLFWLFFCDSASLGCHVEIGHPDANLQKKKNTMKNFFKKKWNKKKCKLSCIHSGWVFTKLHIVYGLIYTYKTPNIWQCTIFNFFTIINLGRIMDWKRVGRKKNLYV